jgi:hypothetical protein
VFFLAACFGFQTLFFFYKLVSYFLHFFLPSYSEVGITGAVLTKLDGDTRGGAAISVRLQKKHFFFSPVLFVALTSCLLEVVM